MDNLSLAEISRFNQFNPTEKESIYDINHVKEYTDIFRKSIQIEQTVIDFGNAGDLITIVHQIASNDGLPFSEEAINLKLEFDDILFDTTHLLGSFSNKGWHSLDSIKSAARYFSRALQEPKFSKKQALSQRAIGRLDGIIETSSMMIEMLAPIGDQLETVEDSARSILASAERENIELNEEKKLIADKIGELKAKSEALRVSSGALSNLISEMKIKEAELEKKIDKALDNALIVGIVGAVANAFGAAFSAYGSSVNANRDFQKELSDSASKEIDEKKSELDELEKEKKADKKKSKDAAIKVENLENEIVEEKSSNNDSDKISQLEKELELAKNEHETAKEKHRRTTEKVDAAAKGLESLGKAFEEIGNDFSSQVQGLQKSFDSVWEKRLEHEKLHREQLSELESALVTIDAQGAKSDDVVRIIAAVAIVIDLMQKVKSAINNLQQFWKEVRKGLVAVKTKNQNLVSDMKFEFQDDIGSSLEFVVDEYVRDQLIDLFYHWTSLTSVFEIAFQEISTVKSKFSSERMKNVEVSELILNVRANVQKELLERAKLIDVPQT